MAPEETEPGATLRERRAEAPSQEGPLNGLHVSHGFARGKFEKAESSDA